MNLLKIRKWEAESYTVLLSLWVFIFSVSEEEVEVMDTKLQISSHSNKSHQPVFTGRLNKLHRVVKKKLFQTYQVLKRQDVGGLHFYWGTEKEDYY